MRRILVVVLGLVLTLAFSVDAFAQPEKGQRRSTQAKQDKQDGKAKQVKQDGKGRQRGDAVKRFDTDGDGKLCPEEYKAGFKKAPEGQFEKIDANKDGFVTREEMRKMRQKQAQEKKKKLLAADKDKDGKVTLAEYKAVFPKANPKAFERLDTDKDGSLSAEEIKKIGARRGGKDKDDKDGKGKDAPQASETKDDDKKPGKKPGKRDKDKGKPKN